MSDSKNVLYLIQFGTKKSVRWPKADHRFEHTKAKTKKRINHLEKHLAKLKDQYKTLMGHKYISKNALFAVERILLDFTGFHWISLDSGISVL